MFWNKKKEKELPNCFARTYGVELFFEKIPEIPVNSLFELIKQRCGNVEMITSSDNLISFIYKDNIVKYDDGEAPAQIAIMITDHIIDPKSYEMNLYQSWSWQEAKSIISQCKHTILVTDFLSSGLDYQVRLDCF